MDKEHLFIKAEMWVVEGEDGKIDSTRYRYELPEIAGEFMIELYRLFLESLCKEIAKVPGAKDLLGLYMNLEEEDET